MALPSSIKIKKDGVEYTNSVNAVCFVLNELIRMALRDCGKLIVKRTRSKITKRTGIGAKSVQYFVRSKKEIPDLQVGVKPKGFYIGFLETGTSSITKKGYIYKTTKENINEMQKIQSQYLSGISEPEPSIDSEDDYESDGDFGE